VRGNYTLAREKQPETNLYKERDRLLDAIYKNEFPEIRGPARAIFAYLVFRMWCTESKGTNYPGVVMEGCQDKSKIARACGIDPKTVKPALDLLQGQRVIVLRPYIVTRRGNGMDGIMILVLEDKIKEIFADDFEDFLEWWKS
jgi:hypothetical protein